MNFRLAVIGLACCVFSTAYAQDKLPNELTGDAMWSGRDARHNFVVPFAMVIESQEPNGAIRGKMSWNSSGGCVVSERPFSGTYRDGALEFSAPPVPKCGALAFKMKRTSASGFAFDGTVLLPTSITASVSMKQK
jgi:hypothetical protein